MKKKLIIIDSYADNTILDMIKRLNIEVVRRGGYVAKVARDEIEKELGKSVVTKNNALKYQYMEETKKSRVNNKTLVFSVNSKHKCQ